MSLPVVYRPRVGIDLAAAFDWYEERQLGLGEELLSAIQTTLRAIELHPEIISAVHSDVRRAVISRFPFAVFYVLEAHRVVVLRVLHTMRDPRIWPRYRR